MNWLLFQVGFPCAKPVGFVTLREERPKGLALAFQCEILQSLRSFRMTRHSIIGALQTHPTERCYCEPRFLGWHLHRTAFVAVQVSNLFPETASLRLKWQKCCYYFVLVECNSQHTIWYMRLPRLA